MLSYLVVYTPLKLRVVALDHRRRDSGRAAAAHRLGRGHQHAVAAGGWVLFAIVFLWQMPHFLAIAWMHRDDYAQAGMPLLPVIEPDGRSTGRQAVLYAAATDSRQPAADADRPGRPALSRRGLVLGAIVLWLAFEFAATRTHAAARRLFFATIIYLPLLWGALVADHATR